MCYKILVLWIILPDYHGYIGDYIFLRFSVFYTSTEGEVCFLTSFFFYILQILYFTYISTLQTKIFIWCLLRFLTDKVYDINI